MIIAFGVGYVVAYLLVLGVLLYMAYIIERNLHLRCAADVVLVFGNVFMIGLLIYLRQRTRNRWIVAEAEKWLASRSRRARLREHPWRRKLRSLVLWIPSGGVLAIFLFFPETAGLVSHLFCGRSVLLNQYRLETPLTWIVASRGSASSAWVIAGKGIGRVGLRPYWRKEEPVSEMVFFATSSSDPPNEKYLEEYLAHAKLLSKRMVWLGQETLICWDIVPYAETRPTPMDPRFAEILCSTAQNSFRANFVGWRSDSSAFYEALHSAALTK